jgi:hypothetical protein
MGDASEPTRRRGRRPNKVKNPEESSAPPIVDPELKAEAQPARVGQHVSWQRDYPWLFK